jgi:Ca-activated chloride channel homolog
VSFGAPDLLPLALAAPLAALAALWLLGRRERAESAWVGRALAARMRRGGAPRPRALVATLVGLALLGTSLALARPRWGETSETVERRGLDLVILLDVSLSMTAGDVPPSRFAVAQALVRRLVAAMPEHRVALVAFEGDGEVMTPLTVDAAMIDLLLDGLAPGTLPLPGSGLAAAIERALALFPEGGERHRALLMISDGEDHGRGLESAATALRSASATFFAIGVGTAHGAPLPVPGSATAFKRDARGEPVISRLRPETLRRLAEGSGGLYLEATSPATDPAPIVRAIRARGGHAFEASTVSVETERFQWPLAAGVLALGALLALSPWRRPEEMET